MSGRRNTNLYGNRIVTVAGVPVPDRHPVMLTVALLGFSPGRPSAFRMVAKTERNALGGAGLTPSSATVSITGWRSGTGTPATVTIRFPYRFVFLRPLMGWTSQRAAISLATAFTMRNE